MGIFRYYLTLILFSGGLLLGVQAPNFVDQYEKRIDAHLMEAKAQLAGFTEIADQLYGGNMAKLIERHAESRDPAFNAEQQVLVENYDRMERFETARGKLSVSLLGKIVQVLFYPEKELLTETMQNYSAAFPLTLDAIVCGLIGAVVVCMVFEMMLVILGAIVRLLSDLGSRNKTMTPPRRAPKRHGKKPSASVITLPDQKQFNR